MLCLLLATLLAGCGGIPNNSSPQPLNSFERQGPTEAVPSPQADMDPEALVRAFLKAAAAPANAHVAARRFLTPSSARQWDERGDTIVLDAINTFVDQRSQNAVRMRLVGDNVGVLKSDGVLTPATGQVETTLSLVRVRDQWRIDGPLPDGVMVDKAQFEAGYRPVSLYFTDRDRQHLVADPRWLYAGRDSDATTLVNKLIDGPSTDLEPAVDSALPTGAGLRGPVTAISGGGVRIELTGLAALPVRDRNTLAAQIIWTLDGADIAGPYEITADGAPLVPERAAGWRTTDVKSFDPAAVPATDVGLNIIRDGALLKVTDSGTTPSGGPLGTGRDLRSASIAPDGSRVAAAVARPGPNAGLALVTAPYGGAPTTVTSGPTITRPSFGADADTVWAVVDGRPVQWIRDAESGAVRTLTVDAAQIGRVVGGPITEMQVAPDGVRVAMIVSGQVVFAVVATNEDGQVSLVNPRIAAYNIGNRAVSLDWASPTLLVIARDAADSPVVQLSINGTPAVGLLSGNVAPPVRALVANTSTIYIGDQRGVLRLGSTDGQPDEYWTEVEPAMAPGVIPVLP
ncbi:MtrAB system accessory lipoprotein LpqB [Gordonia sinesedis]